jgi:hypothetical protein
VGEFIVSVEDLVFKAKEDQNKHCSSFSICIIYIEQFHKTNGSRGGKKGKLLLVSIH